MAPDNVGAGERPATGHHYPHMPMVQVIEANDMARQHLKKSYMAFPFTTFSTLQAVWLADVVKVCQAILH